MSEELSPMNQLPASASQGWRVDDAKTIVFVGGQISADQKGAVVGVGDIEAQTRNVFTNISRVLRDAGAHCSDVVRLDAFYMLEDGMDPDSYWDTVSKVSAEFMSDPGPVWTAVRVPGLAYPGLLIEIDAVALVGDE
jgi:enamine deaminase RidA (YjgF/YER057c/UK114 family)